MRIVSLFPAATEIVCALGLGQSLVGRSHNCDFPADIASVPEVTAPAADFARMAGGQIDRAVAERAAAGQGSLRILGDRLAQAQPDLVLAPAALEGFLQSADGPRALAGELAGPALRNASILSFAPSTLDDIYAMILAIGEATDASASAGQVVLGARNRLDRIQTQLSRAVHRPWLAALLWLDPLIAPGHWIPQQIELAGGQCALGEAGQSPKPIEWDDVIHAQPEMVVAMPCGMDLAGSVSELKAQAGSDAWLDMPATHLNQIYAVDASPYFSRPGPRVVQGVEILAGLLHPNVCRHPLDTEAARLTLDVRYGDSSLFVPRHA